MQGCCRRSPALISCHGQLWSLSGDRGSTFEVSMPSTLLSHVNGCPSPWPNLLKCWWTLRDIKLVCFHISFSYSPTNAADHLSFRIWRPFMYIWTCWPQSLYSASLSCLCPIETFADFPAETGAAVFLAPRTRGECQFLFILFYIDLYTSCVPLGL